MKKLMISLVEQTIAEDQYEWGGVTWARRPQSFYAEKLGVSLKTIGRYINKSPFVKKVVSAKGGGAKGGGTLTLLRIGKAPPSLTDNHAKNVMIKLYSAAQDKIDNPDGKWVVNQRGGRYLWGFAKDVRVNIGDKLGWPAETSRELAIATFKYALFDWTAVAGTIKFVAGSIPGYKPRYYKFLTLGALCRFSEAAVYAYVMHVQFNKPKLPAGLECLAEMTVSAKLLNHIDSLMPEGCVLS